MLHYQPLTTTGSIVLVRSDRAVPWICNGLIVTTGRHTVLIDCNFDTDELAELLARTDGAADAYFVTHVHIDHVNNLKNLEANGVAIHCPRPEDAYLRDFRTLLAASGSTALGMDELMLHFAHGTQGFRECPSVRGFEPGTRFRFGGITLESLPLPGHSPGHTGFGIAVAGDPDGQCVLFAADIGLDEFGAWYGFDYCSLPDYRRSVAHLKQRYASGGYLLAGSHDRAGTGVHDAAALDAIIGKLDTTRACLLERLCAQGPARLEDLVLTGLIYSRSSIARMSAPLRALYGFWEYYSLNNHVKECTALGLVAVREDGTFEATGGTS